MRKKETIVVVRKDEQGKAEKQESKKKLPEEEVELLRSEAVKRVNNYVSKFSNVYAFR
jgi:hypothetical protein